MLYLLDLCANQNKHFNSDNNFSKQNAQEQVVKLQMENNSTTTPEVQAAETDASQTVSPTIDQNSSFAAQLDGITQQKSTKSKEITKISKSKEIIRKKYPQLKNIKQKSTKKS